MRFRFLFALAILFVLASACSYNHSKHQDEAEPLNQDAIDNPDFATIQASIIGPKCLSCHSKDHGNAGGLNLEGYDAVKAHLVGGKGIVSRVLGTRDMPPGGPIGSPFDRMLKNWVDNGAPVVVTQRQDNELTNGANDFARIRDHVFVAHRCTDCHGDFQPMANLNLTDYEQAKAAIMPLIVRLISRHDHPPAPYPPISEKELQAMVQWADAGMPK